MPERVRAACPDEAGRLAEIDREVNPVPWSERSFRESIVSSRALVALDAARRIIGFVVFQVALDESEILTIAVQPGQQRHGAGARLLGAALATARASGARSCYLEVRESNHAAQAFYAAHGFVPAGRRRAYYGAGEDAILLRLDLN